MMAQITNIQVGVALVVVAAVLITVSIWAGKKWLDHGDQSSYEEEEP